MIHSSVIFFGKDRIKIGKNVRIDCYSVLSAGPAGIEIGDNVHISSAVQIFGFSGKVIIESFAGISPRATLLTATDDFVEGHMIGPCVPEEYRKVQKGNIIVCRHAVIGCGSVVLPGVTIGQGASVGALSLIKFDVPEYAVVVGIPQRQIGTRNRQLLEELERKYLNDHPDIRIPV